MIKVFKLTNPRLCNFALYFYSMSDVRRYRSEAMGEPITDDIIEEVDFDDHKQILDYFGGIHEVAKCEFFRKEDDESQITVYDGTLYIRTIDEEEAKFSGYKITE